MPKRNTTDSGLGDAEAQDVLKASSELETENARKVRSNARRITTKAHAAAEKMFTGFQREIDQLHASVQRMEKISERAREDGDLVAEQIAQYRDEVRQALSVFISRLSLLVRDQMKPERNRFHGKLDSLLRHHLDPVLATEISELPFSYRARKSMNRLDIRNLGDLVQRTADELLESKGFGEVTLAEVRTVLTERGLKLNGDTK